MNMQSKFTSVLIWDLPIRLTHWLLVGLVITLFATSQSDLYYDMELHQYCGIAVLALLIFRLLWGIFGSTHARFNQFICGPRATLQYLSHLFERHPSQYIGHNPLGGWSVVFLLLFLLIQSVTGLFANDDIDFYGPLSVWLSDANSGLLTKIHKLNFNILLIFVGLHITAIFFYLLFKRENLVRPMITGRKHLSVEQAAIASQTSLASLWLALFLLAIAVISVYLLVFVAP